MTLSATVKQGTEQLSLEGIEPAQTPTDRLFFAVFPDAGTAARISGLAQQLRGEHGLKGRALAPERFHVTLQFLGDHAGLPPDMVTSARGAAATVRMPAFDVSFDSVMSFHRPGKRPFVMRGGAQLAALAGLQQALGASMRDAGLGRWVQPHFTPHLTLLYDTHPVERQAVEPISWTAREFVLMHSLIGKKTHLPLGRWPLQG